MLRVCVSYLIESKVESNDRVKKYVGEQRNNLTDGVRDELCFNTLKLQSEGSENEAVTAGVGRRSFRGIARRRMRKLWR